MIRSLFGRLFSATSAIIVFGICALVILFTFTSTSAWQQERLGVLENNARAIADANKHISITNNQADIDRIAATVADAYDSTVFFVDNNGITYICSDFNEHRNCVHITESISNKIMIQIQDKGIYKETGTLSGIYNKDYYTVGVIVYNTYGEDSGAVFVSAATDSVTNYTPVVIRVSVIISIGVIILLMLFIYLYTRGLLKPIHQMTDAAKAMSKGDFSRRVYAPRNDEIYELAESFNAMCASLESLEEMRSSFISNVSHELKTPMTTIGGFIDAILGGTIPKEKQNYYLSIVSDEIKRLSTLVNAMLYLSKLESGQSSLICTKTDITDIICRVIISFERELGLKDIQIIGMENAPQVYAECDEKLIYQAIYNLFENAVKFTPREGYISLFVHEYNSRVELYIKNSGDGIPEEDVDHIFERFYKTDKSRSIDKNGVGLGLHIVKSIISYHNGDIQVKSVAGQYTQFALMLPKLHANGDIIENK